MISPAIHAVDKVHIGTGDSSVLYIPVCPVTETNVTYLEGQRAAFRKAIPPADFPGGVGEVDHVDHPTEETFRSWTNDVGRRALGLEKLVAGEDALPGEMKIVEKANSILGFG